MRVCLPKGSLLGRKVTAFDHWVTAKDLREARHKIAYQIVNGDSEGKRSEPFAYFNNLGINWVKEHIDLCDLEVGK